MVVTFLAIGSNLGDREAYLKHAMQGLRDHGVDIVRSASVYETEPKDVEGQPWFLNTVVEARTDLTPQQLLEVCLSVERQNHRVRSLPKSSRTLDIDIVFYGNEVVHQTGLTIPHPRFSERNFVLIPLAEIAPDFVDPVSGATIEVLKSQSKDPAHVRRVASGEQLLDSIL